MLDRIRSDQAGPWIVAGGVFLLVICLGTILFALSNVYESVYHDYAASKQHAEYQQQFQEKCVRLTTVEGIRRCFQEDVKPTREAQRAEEDLYAQKQMAEWAWWMVVVSVAVGAPTVTLTVVGVYFVVKTFNEQKRATDVATDTAQRQLRAYVFVHRNQISNFGVGERPSVQVFMKNSGQTPAYSMTSHMEIGVGPYPARSEHFPHFSPPAPDASNAAVPATGEIDTGVIKNGALTQHEVTEISQGRAALYVSGYIKYFDTFDDEQTTNFRLMYTKRCIDRGDPRLEICGEGNDAT